MLKNKESVKKAWYIVKKGKLLEKQGNMWNKIEF